MSKSKVLVAKTLYRTLLRTAKLFSKDTPNGPILSSFLYRSGTDDYMDYKEEAQVKQSKSEDIDEYISILQARNLSHSYQDIIQQRKKSSQEWSNTSTNIGNEEDKAEFLYKGLVKQVVGEKQHMHFPHRILQEEDDIMQRLKHVIQSEFRSDENNESLSQYFDEKIRVKAAFLAIKELQKKLAWAESMGMQLNTGCSCSQAEDQQVQLLTLKNVIRLPTDDPSVYLQPGVFLIAHPLLTGCFQRSVICLLQHTEGRSHEDIDQEAEFKDEEGDGDDTIGGTYGLVINSPIRTGVPTHTSEQKRDRTLREIIRNDCLPEGIKTAFGNNPVRNGGPVNMSVQMMRKTTSEGEQKLELGGSLLQSGSNQIQEMETSAALNDDCAIYHGGDIIKAAQSVIDNEIEKDAYSFIVGASCWEQGQLQSEVEKGFWIPCVADPKIAFSGECNVEGTNGIISVSEGSLWVSMMSSIGREEGILAQLTEHIDFDENGFPCDDV
ncbi:hypothetical protein CTEN210_01367 [Chaetoceros tenuissimus]|uniref:Uncharacterized protein n=1 Tax=Chaetoceros tenuissimus TaxID=426638 RepID=A0AAD3CFW8_9STRA|nr:hypothetical protein CTEN210_01367 [Chaetoceros tenuissimus]